MRKLHARSPQAIVRLLLLGGLLLLGVWGISGVIASIVVETQWFNHLGYLANFWLRTGTQVVAWFATVGLSLLFIGINLRLAYQWQHSIDNGLNLQQNGNPVRREFDRVRLPQSALQPALSRPLSFGWLLLLAGGASLLTSLLVIHYGQSFWQIWNLSMAHPNANPSIPDRFRFETLGYVVGQLWTVNTPVLTFGGVWGWVAGAIAMLIYPRSTLSTIALLFSAIVGTVWAANWSSLLLLFQGRSYGQVEPLFGRDISFYLFALPIWQLVEFWLIGLTLYTLLAVLLWYVLSGNSLSQGTFPGFSQPQQHHLSNLAGCFMLVLALSYWIRRYELLYSTRGVVFGAAYAEVHVQLPCYTLLAGFSAAIALFLFWQARPVQLFRARKNRILLIHQTVRTVSWSLLLLTSFWLLEVSSAFVLPVAVQQFIVQPNELTRELPYIRQNIALTRAAFNLDTILVENFDPQGNLTYADLLENDPTIRNIRLWDTRPLLQTNRQLQQIRPYYRFYGADLDRYNLVTQRSTATNPQSSELPSSQQVLMAARELDYEAVPPDAKTWVNEHLVYTHGYGFTLSPVNKVAPGGLPDYFVKDIGGTPESPGKLTPSSEVIRASIPIGEPRIYFGELTNTYIMSNTKASELDYPSGSDNVYTTYDGLGGINIGTIGQRLMFARYLHDWQMLLTSYFTPNTQIMLRRNIKQRLQTIAPFLRYDDDPYLVTADINCLGLNIQCGEKQSDANTSPTPNYLYWIVDAYTISNHYPYSAPSKYHASDMPERDRFNYIRNSVKVVIDAYNGAVNFYMADPSDPIIQAWSRIFPGMFRSLKEMPSALRSHIRYPFDLFSIQSERLTTYHMTDPQVFYNREDQWQIPEEIYGNEPRAIEPYFLITNLPTVVELEEFILLLPFKPTQRTNLIAWLAARSDGENYGKLLLYVFPKQELVFGIEQIEARINQDPVISQKITLWNRQGSRVLQGNLLVIPIEQSLLYVEPLYLEAERNSLPTLVSVVVANNTQIAMASTLEEALKAVFQPATSADPAIIRPVE